MIIAGRKEMVVWGYPQLVSAQIVRGLVSVTFEDRTDGRAQIISSSREALLEVLKTAVEQLEAAEDTH